MGVEVTTQVHGAYAYRVLETLTLAVFGDLIYAAVLAQERLANQNRSQ